jgi:hypothetical protein
VPDTVYTGTSLANNVSRQALDSAVEPTRKENSLEAKTDVEKIGQERSEAEGHWNGVDPAEESGPKQSACMLTRCHCSSTQRLEAQVK